MKVRFRYTGGFGGLSFGCDLDSKTLPKTEANKLDRLVKKANLSDVTLRGSDKARDLLNYTIEIETKDEMITATFDDMSIPKNVKPLIKFLRGNARTVPLDKVAKNSDG
jgi:hypothetical protein